MMPGDELIAPHLVFGAAQQPHLQMVQYLLLVN
jgi:hypothetical protein